MDKTNKKILSEESEEELTELIIPENFFKSFKQKLTSKSKYAYWILGMIAGAIIMFVIKIISRMLK